MSQNRMDGQFSGRPARRTVLVATLLVLLVALVGLSGCGGSSPSNASSQQNSPADSNATQPDGSASSSDGAHASNGGEDTSADSTDTTAEDKAGAFAGTWSFVTLQPADAANASKVAELEKTLQNEQDAGGYVELVITNDIPRSYSQNDGQDASQLLLAYRKASDAVSSTTETGGIALSDATHASYRELWDGTNFANDYFDSTLELSADGQTLTEASDEYTATYRRVAGDDRSTDMPSPENVEPQQIDVSAAHVKLGKGETAWRLDRLEFAMPAGAEGLTWPEAFSLGSRSYDAQAYARKEVATTSTRLSAQTEVENEWDDYQSKMGRVPGRGQSAIEHLTVSGHDAIRFTRDGATNGDLKVFVHAMVLVVDVDGRRYVLECDLRNATDELVANPQLDKTLEKVVGSAVVV